MTGFISEAYAQAAPATQQQADPILSMLPLVLIFVLLYFVMIRPQSKRAKEHKKMVEGLARGDEIVTNGGIVGRVTEVGDNFVAVEISDGVTVKLQRQAVATLLPKGSAKTL
jgi:preprotein translocase subunit YajC